jgi:hypothetical protein
VRIDLENEVKIGFKTTCFAHGVIFQNGPNCEAGVLVGAF